MKTIARVILVAALAFGPGCARSDWIGETLVTADVTGTWRSTAGSTTYEFALEQQGPKVKGFLKTEGEGGGATAGTAGLGLSPRTRPIDGTMAGDVFSFRTDDREFTGELTVSVDEMSGPVWGRARRDRISVRRVDSSPRPNLKEP